MDQLQDYLGAGDIVLIDETPEVPLRVAAQRLPRGLGFRRVPVELVLQRRIASDKFVASARPADQLWAGDTLHFRNDLEAEILSQKDGEIELLFDRDSWDLDRAIHEIGVPIEQEKEPGLALASNLQLLLSNLLLQQGIIFERLTTHRSPDPATEQDKVGQQAHLDMGLAARLNAARTRGNRIAAVGPAAVRVLEDLSGINRA
jgi:S-adenosylmethionine:tRNA-ribosyltransferase-isomerase (queuine synthetase)